ncbi:uncharacterized protein METZ01_LOCUS329274, partial [marine metagenome]
QRASTAQDGWRSGAKRACSLQHAGV